jgi:hypothetical protein
MFEEIGTAAKYGLMTINEIRTRYFGLRPIDSGDEFPHTPKGIETSEGLLEQLLREERKKS